MATTKVAKAEAVPADEPPLNTLDVSVLGNAPDPSYRAVTTAQQIEGVVSPGACEPGKEAVSVTANRKGGD